MILKWTQLLQGICEGFGQEGSMAADEIVSWLAFKTRSYNLTTPDGFTIHNPIHITNCDMHKLEKPNHEDSMLSEVIFVF